MKYFYSEIDEITLTFGDIHLNKSGMEYIKIYFERPNDNGFDFLESSLPALEVKKFAGFNGNEIKNLLDYAKINSFLIWDIARENLEIKEAANVANLMSKKICLSRHTLAQDARHLLFSTLASAT